MAMVGKRETTGIKERQDTCEAAVGTLACETQAFTSVFSFDNAEPRRMVEDKAIGMCCEILQVPRIRLVITVDNPQALRTVNTEGCYPQPQFRSHNSYALAGM